MNRIVVSKSFDPAYNLALEEYLMDSGDRILYLWQNDETIVIGRNQDPYKECNIAKLRQDSIKLVRRKSGGGAVFHDLGNLNFTIISKLNRNNLEENFKMVNQALAYEGIESIFNGRNDLEVGNKKISGNAFYQKDDSFCHHGSLLVDVDMNRLASYLTASKLKLEAKGIKSVKSRVANLVDFKADIKITSVKESFIKSYCKSYPVDDIEYFSEKDMQAISGIMDRVKNYKSWEWTYGQSPKSNLILEDRFSWGIMEISLYIEGGFIKEIGLNTDSIINENFEALRLALKCLEFKKDKIIEVIEETIDNEIIREDIISQFNEL